MKVNATLFIVLVTLMNACKPDYDAPCRAQAVKITNDFTTNQLASIPYGSDDSIVFVSSNMDTLRLLTQAYQSGYTFLPSVVEGNPECPRDVDGYQLIQTTLFDSSVAIGIGGVWKKQTDSCRYQVDGRNYDLSIAQIGYPEVVPYADSITLNENTYYAVSTIYGTAGDSILLTKTEGIIYFIEGGKPYQLLSFKR